MAYRTGPLVGPEMYRRFALPRYRRVVDYVRSRGVPHVCLDSDGNVSSLIPIWMDAGIDTGDVILQRYTPIQPEEDAGELAARLADLDPDGYRRFVCVEAAIFRAPIVLEPYQTWRGGQTLTIEPTPGEGAPLGTSREDRLSDNLWGEARVRDVLALLHRVGLDYIHVGQQATTLSGGEAQRVKLAKELSKRATGRTLYILDEPTTGLHFEDIQLLLRVLHNFVDAGNTVLVVEHNLEVVKTADWVIDLGPEGGEEGAVIGDDARIGVALEADLLRRKSQIAERLGQFLPDRFRGRVRYGIGGGRR